MLLVEIETVDSTLVKAQTEKRNRVLESEVKAILVICKTSWKRICVQRLYGNQDLNGELSLMKCVDKKVFKTLYDLRLYGLWPYTV